MYVHQPIFLQHAIDSIQVISTICNKIILGNKKKHISQNCIDVTTDSFPCISTCISFDIVSSANSQPETIRAAKICFNHCYQLIGLFAICNNYPCNNATAYFINKSSAVNAKAIDSWNCMTLST